MPQSWKWRGWKTPDIGALRDRKTAMTIRNAKPEIPWLATR